jgi:hypothetical protein
MVPTEWTTTQPVILVILVTEIGENTGTRAKTWIVCTVNSVWSVNKTLYHIARVSALWFIVYRQPPRRRGGEKRQRERERRFYYIEKKTSGSWYGSDEQNATRGSRTTHDQISATRNKKYMKFDEYLFHPHTYRNLKSKFRDTTLTVYTSLDRYRMS